MVTRDGHPIDAVRILPPSRGHVHMFIKFEEYTVNADGGSLEWEGPTKVYVHDVDGAQRCVDFHAGVIAVTRSPPLGVVGFWSPDTTMGMVTDPAGEKAVCSAPSFNLEQPHQ